MSEQKQVLTDQELGQTAGGVICSQMKPIYNKYNDKCGMIDYKGVIHYYACLKCGRPMHYSEFGWGCIPCGKYFVIPTSIWTGSIAELKAASEDYEPVDCF